MDDVITHGTLRLGGIAGHDRLGDQVVVEERFRACVRDELENAERRDPLTEASRHIRNAFVMGALVDEFVKLLVKLAERRVFLGNCLFQSLIEHLHATPLQRRHAFCAKART